METREAILADVLASQVFIGDTELLQPKLTAPGGEAPQSNDADVWGRWEKAQREIQVRLGTLLKADSLSLLLAAGCSLAAGGVSLRTLPARVESELLERGLTGEEASEWLSLLYAAVGRAEVDVLARRETAREIANNEWDAVDAGPQQKQRREEFELPVNLEALLERLHAWRYAAESAELGIQAGDGAVMVEPDTLDLLIGELTRALAICCRLPRPGFEDTLEPHVGLVRRLVARPVGLRRVGIFTLNYDTLIEQALDAEGVTTIDGFVGRARPSFRPESYDHDLYFPTEQVEGRVHRLDRVMRLYKLHGSTTWRRQKSTAANPYGIALREEVADPSPDELLIYPSPLKYGETLGMPYAEMFRRFAASVVRPQSVLVVMGYSFGDEHVNAIVRQALAVPSFTLVVVDPSPGSFVQQLQSEDDERVWVVSGPLGRMGSFVEHLVPSLREEEVARKVAATFDAMGEKRDVGRDAR